MEKLPISLVINTFQADRYLDLTLQSAQDFVQEIIIVDMNSTDNTREIATKFSAKIYDFPFTGYVEPARNFAVQQATQPWILILDADEFLPQKIRQTIHTTITSDLADMIYLPWQNYMFGHPILGCRFEPERELHLRLFKAGMVTFGDQVHAPITPNPSGRILKLNPEDHGVVWHFNYTTISSFVQKLDRYTSLEASQPTLSPASHKKIIRKAIREFTNRYFRAKGYKLGWPGLSVSFLMAFYEVVKQLKIHEQSEFKSEELIVDSYRELANQELGSFK